MSDTIDLHRASSEEVGKILGLTGRQVNFLRKNGTLPYIAEESTRTRFLYDVPMTVKAYMEYYAGGGNGSENSKTERDRADARYKRARAERAELEVSEIRGQMHRSEDVEAAVTQFGAAVRGEFLALPGRVAIDVSHATTPMEAAAIIKSACYESLNRLSEFQYKPEFYAERVRERVQWLSDNDLGKIAKKDNSEK